LVLGTDDVATKGGASHFPVPLPPLPLAGEGRSTSGLFGHLVGLLDGFLDAADHVERLLRQVVVLALDDALEAADGVLERDVLARGAGEDLGDVARLAEEALDLAGAGRGTRPACPLRSARPCPGSR